MVTPTSRLQWRRSALPVVSRVWLCSAAFALVATGALSADAPTPAEGADDDSEDVTKMAAYNVQADRVEEFGFRVGGNVGLFSGVFPTVRAVYPNTAAAKAGLRPGERILTTDGASAGVTLFSLTKWRKLQAKKWAEVSSGKKTVTWTLEVESADRKEKRTVKMTVPTAPPRWGATKWQAPEGRVPAMVAEAGPLAELARAVLDNGIWISRGGYVFPEGGMKFTNERPMLAFEWTLQDADRMTHRILVTQARGKTDIAFECFSREKGYMAFLTSPSGALGYSHARLAKKEGEVSSERMRAEFQKELEFWLNDVTRTGGRWPFALRKPNSTGEGNIAVLPKGELPPPAAAVATAIPMGQRADSFLKLTPATEAQRALFADALGKLGADEGYWAYTETARGLEDKRVTVVRVDPSKPDAERCTLLKIDGKVPTAEQVKAWRFEGRDVSPALGDLPPISRLVDTNDLRVAADELTSVLFELPLRGGNAQFPAEKFQAVFRVNKAHRGFEDFAVKMREAFKVAGVVKVLEAGMEARFQTLDPAHPPQPVLLKAGGGVRVLLVKFSRSFESTRTDFRRVEPYAETPAAN